MKKRPGGVSGWVILGLVGVGVAGLVLGLGAREKTTPKDEIRVTEPALIAKDADKVVWSDARVSGGGTPENLAFSNDGGVLTWVTPFSGIKRFDAAKGKPLDSFGTDGDHAIVLKPSADGQWLVGGCSGGVVQFWDAKTGKAGQTFQVSKWGVYGVGISPAGDLVAADGSDGTAQVWDVASGKRIFVLGDQRTDSDRVEGVAFSPDGAHLAIRSRYGRFEVWDTRTGKLEHRMPGRLACEGHNRVRFTPDGKKVVGAGEDGVVIWEYEKKEGGVTYVKAPEQLQLRMREEITDNESRGVEIMWGEVAADGVTAAVTLIDENVGVWDVKTGVVKGIFSCGQKGKAWDMRVRCLAFSPDSKRLGFALENGSVGIWNIE